MLEIGIEIDSGITLFLAGIGIKKVKLKRNWNHAFKS